MSPPLEPHDYIGLSAAAASPSPTSSSSCSSSPNPGGSGAEVVPGLTLRLGLPGSESPDHDAAVAATLTLGPLLSNHKAASSKRAFPEASPRRTGSAAAAAAARSEEKAPSATAPPAAK